MAERKKPLPKLNIRSAPPPYDEFIPDDANKSEYLYFADGDRQPCADRVPFRPDARGFELVNAWWLSEAATLAYSAPALAEPVFEHKTPLQQVRTFATGGGTECFVASNEEFAIAAFRGSELTPRPGSPRDFYHIIKDWLRDFDIRTSNSVPGATVHRGFADGVKDVWENEGFGDYVKGLRARKVWFTGHSLGAALATLAAARALDENVRVGGLYTFGSPRVGDGDFADSFRRMMAEEGLTYFRFVNGDDAVTAVPLVSKLRPSIPPFIRFKHAGTPKYIDRGGQITDEQNRLEELRERVLAILTGMGASPHAGVDIDRLFNGIPRAVEDHVPTLYSTHIWNAYVEEQGGGD
jgi:triacylglycerol lipase